MLFACMYNWAVFTNERFTLKGNKVIGELSDNKIVIISLHYDFIFNFK